MKREDLYLQSRKALLIMAVCRKTLTLLGEEK